MLGGIRYSASQWQELQELLRDPVNREKFSKAAPRLVWWKEYERPYPSLLRRALVGVGMAPLVREHFLPLAKKSSVTAGEVVATLNSATDELLSSASEPPSLKRALKSGMAMYAAQMSIMIYEEPINALIARAATDKNAFMKAIRVDPASSNCAAMRARLNLAYSSKDTPFLKEYINAMATPVTFLSRQHLELHYCLLVLHGMRQLSPLTGAERVTLFIDKLRIYAGGHDDPAGSLKQLIARWLKVNDKYVSPFVVAQRET